MKALLLRAEVHFRSAVYLTTAIWLIITIARDL